MSFRNLFGPIARSVVRKVRRESSNNLFWSRYEPRNFGDWIGPYLFQKIRGYAPTFSRTSNRSLLTTYVTAGSIMRHVRGDNAIVWGAGIISRNDVFQRPRETLAVRGPYTRDRFLELGYPCPEVYGDPAIILPFYYSPKPAGDRFKIGIAPHFIHFDRIRELYKGIENLKLIDVTQSVEKVIDDISSCDAVVSSSLHGLIVSNAYGIPAAWFECENPLDGDRTKFYDFFASGGILQAKPPLVMSRAIEPERLIEYVSSVEQPNVTPLAAPLRDACPFIRD